MPAKKCGPGCQCGKHGPRPWLEEARKKGWETNRGVKRSLETRKKMSEFQKARFADPLQRATASRVASEKFSARPDLKILLSERQAALWLDPQYRSVHEAMLVDARARREIADPTSPYKTIRLADHPLARSGGSVLLHRVVLYDAIGPGPHPCHWMNILECGQDALEWTHDIYGICVDHLDRNRRNNDVSNLVPACHSCNIRRHHVYT